MIFGWMRRRRRARILAEPFPESSRRVLEGLPLYGTLTEEERARLVEILRVIVAEKRWEACGGLEEVTEEMRLIVAAHAALLVLAIPHDHYHGLRSILIYPSTYASSVPRPDRMGVVSVGAPLAGESWHSHGPVVLTWDAVRAAVDMAGDGQNVVLHEFAHKLDQTDGWADGTPPLASRAAHAVWERIMTEEYRRHVSESERGRPAVLDRYGATDPAEFFAVATECFFEKPRQMTERHPSLYACLRDYYAQDPAARPLPRLPARVRG